MAKWLAIRVGEKVDGKLSIEKIVLESLVVGYLSVKTKSWSIMVGKMINADVLVNKQQFTWNVDS